MTLQKHKSKSSRSSRKPKLRTGSTSEARASRNPTKAVPLAKIKEVVSADRFTVHINLHLGAAEHTIYTTDLTPEYVRFNMGE